MDENKPKTTTAPEFGPNMLIGHCDPLIASDKNGVVWRIDPASGTARKVVFEK